MRKIAAIFLIICLLTMPYVGAEENFAGDYQQYYDVLDGLDIICGYEKFDFNATMQRYEFINMVANLYGDTAYTNIKSDDAIALAHGRGLINSIENFEPYTDILYEEAVKIMVCALGYGTLAEFQGGWYQGYIGVAKRIGILDGVEGALNTPMTKGELIQLLYNTVHEPVVEQRVFGDTFEDYSSVDGVTLLSTYRDIYEIREKLEGTEYTMLYSRSGLDKGEVSIGGSVYIYSKNVPDSFLGSMVRAYIRKNDVKDELIYMNKLYPDDTVVISPSGFTSINDTFTQLKYYDESDRERTASIAKSAYVIYNGEAYADYTKADFSVGDGCIVLTDSNDDDVYDVVKITSYDNMYVATVSASGKFVTGEFEYTGALSMLELDEEKTDAKIRYMAPDGTPLSFDSIAPKQVLSVARSKAVTAPVLTVYISDDTAEGTVTLYKNNDTLVMDGLEYTLAKSYLEANAKGEELAKLNFLGQNVVFYLDAFGMVAAAEVIDESKLNYAYATGMNSDGIWTMDVKIRVFESDGIWREYFLAEKVKWNGNTPQKAQNIYTALCPGGRMTPQLIAYELNSKSQINRLETGIAADDSERLIKGENVSGMYTSNNRSINWNVFFDDDTVVWVIPEKKGNESEYYIDSHMYFMNLEQYTVTPYNLDDYKFAPIVVVEEGQNYFNNIKDTGTMYIYLDTIGQLDKNGDTVQAIEVVGGTAGQTSYIVGDNCTIPDLTKGDAVKIKVNKNNVITNIDKCFSFSNKGTTMIPGSGFYTTELMAGYVKKVDYAKQRFIVDCGGEQTLRNDLFSSGTTFIINHNNSRGIIETCGFNDIESGDYVVIRAQHSRLYDVYIIKNLNPLPPLLGD